MGFFLKYPSPDWAQLGWLLLFGTACLLFFCSVPLFVRFLDLFPTFGRKMNNILSQYSQLDVDYQFSRNIDRETESQSNQLERNWEALRAKFTTKFYARLGIIPELIRFALNFIAVGVYISSSYTSGFQKGLGALEVALGVVFVLDYFLRFYLISLDSTLLGFVFRIDSLADLYSIPSLIASGIAFVSYINFNYLRAFNLYYAFVKIYYPGGHDPETQKPKQVSALRPFVFCWILYLFVIIFVSACTVYSLEMMGEIDGWQIVNSAGEPLWNVFNSVYFVVVTISTVGYGDITPTTYPARVATILLIFFVAVYFASKLSTLMEVMQEQKLGSGEYIKRRGTRHVIVIGRHKFSDFEHFAAAFYSSPLNATTHIIVLARYLPWSEEDFAVLEMSKIRDYVHFLRGSAAEVRDLHRAKLVDASAVFAFLAGGSTDRFAEDSVQVIRIHAVRAVNPTVPIFAVLLDRGLHIHIKSCLTASGETPPVFISCDQQSSDKGNQADNDRCISAEMAASGSIPYQFSSSGTEMLGCSICTREFLCSLMSLNVVCDGASTLVANLLFFMKSNHVYQDFPWIWEYKRGVRNEILMSETPNLFIGEKFGICLKAVYELSGMILIGVSTDNTTAEIGHWEQIIPDRSYLYFIGTRAQFHLFKRMESETSSLIEEKLKTLKGAKPSSYSTVTSLSAYDVVEKVDDISDDKVDIKEFRDHIVICGFDEAAVSDIIFLLERIYLFSYGDPLFGFPVNKPPFTVIVHPSISEDKIKSLHKRFPRTYFVSESPEHLKSLESVAIFRARNVVVLSDSSFSFGDSTNDDSLFSGINIENLDRKVVMTLLNLELLLGSYDQTHICIEIKISHSIAFLGLPRPRRRYSYFGLPNESHFVKTDSKDSQKLKEQSSTLTEEDVNADEMQRHQRHQFASTIVNLGPRYLKSLLAKQDENDYIELGISSAATWYRERYASGEVVLDSLPAVLLCREYEHRGVVSLLCEMIGLRNGGSLTTPLLRMIGVPSKWVGWRYEKVFAEIVSFGMIPIALYRSGEAPVSASLLETTQKNFIEELSADISKFQRQFHLGSSASVDAFHAKFYPAQNILPWVFTNPTPDTIVGLRDGLYVLVKPALSSKAFRPIYQ
ncbi:hypothetical protein GpartN1_g5457.t1 [Galdieria partita]|uniref:Uncharacterized protein n=1 Tax=Galdieria partita TaxID=83374 RepID=A0A9C7Q197_9RHOD|nr:hypothetical protein GpartN1_g5457.t1 [Galdieria partita]